MDLIDSRRTERSTPMKRCSRCQAELEASENYTVGDALLCEDCYLERMAQPKACDPWAVYSAKKTAEHYGELTPVQQRILDLLAAEGPLPAAALRTRLDLTETEFRNQFATLRHMEKARACKQGDQVCYTLFAAD